MSGADSGAHHTGWSMRRWFTVVATIGAIGLVTTGVIGILALVRLDSARDELVDRTGPALVAAQDLRLALINQESGIRGYAATADRAFAEPYRIGLADQDTAVAALRAILARSPDAMVQRDLDAVLAGADAWRSGYAEPTLTAVAAGRPPVDPAVGKQLFDPLRAAIGTALADLQRDRDAGRDRLDASIAGLIAVAVVIGTSLAALFAGTWLWARKIIMRPLGSLESAVNAVQSGDFARPVEVSGPRELVRLGDAIDEMRGRIHGELTTVQILNAKLDEQSADLARSNFDLEQFAYVASHDLQEPLRKVSAFCELLAKRYAGQLDERADQYIAFAVDGARRMSALINDLLAFSRVGRTAGGRESWVTVSGADLLAQAERNLGDLLDRTGAAVTHDDLPDVVGEVSLLTTVFQNLVGNAVKFHGDAPPQVHVGARRDGPVWEFAVTDHGIGIDPAYAEKIFVIFQRLHAKEAYPGTGIGLALCRKIVEFHGGRIWLDAADSSSPDSGTTFRFTLPVSEAPA